MDTALAAYLPQDRCAALARGEPLPEHTHGTALFADISGFTEKAAGSRPLQGHGGMPRCVRVARVAPLCYNSIYETDCATEVAAHTISG